ncbi:MAG TPA: alpha/beta fold hydrolase [Solirubrobacterales bacterium]|nr:alpha/beta fold hydrolase [Solirubrobacterales bacterium]
MARPAMQAATASLRDERARRVRRAFAELADRYRGGPADADHTFQIRLGDAGRTWEVRTCADRCEVRPSPTREPDVVIGTDAATWIALREGRMSGLDAFSQRRLYARGDLDLALGFEAMFRLPGDRDPLLRITDAEVGCGRVRSLIAGDGPEHVICMHGLGSNKSSFFETVAALAGDHTVHAIDLPGFGSSAKPARAPYDAEWFATAVLEYLEANALERAHLIGNSMGGRVAIEVAFADADRVASLSLLSPSLAFRRRQLAPLVRLLRPELAAIPHPLREAIVRGQFWDLFAQPERLDPAAADVAVDEFCRIYRSRAARVAFFAAARNLYLDEPHGKRGFYARLRTLEPPALFIWGEADRLIPPAFARHVHAALPRAKQVVLEDCGHVPQVELPERTNGLIREHLAEAAAVAEPEPRSALARALRRAV